MQTWSSAHHGTGIVLMAVLAAGCQGATEPGSAQRQVRNPNAQTFADGAQPLADFRMRVGDYVALQKALSEKVGPLDESKTPVEIATRERALGEAIRAARAGAKPGDIFTPAIAERFRVVIREEFAHRSRLALEDRDEAQDELPDFTPTVNQIYPTTYPLATFPPGVLGHLPPLSAPLEYRFVQRNLILRDIEANLIVDVLPAAAPAMDSLPAPRAGQ